MKQDRLTPYPTRSANLLPITFKFRKVIASQREIDHPSDVSSYYNWRTIGLRDRVLEVHPSSSRTRNTRDRIARLLSKVSMCIPNDDQSAIIEQVLKVLEDPPVRELPIVVYVAEVTLHILDGNDDIIERVTRESLETYIPNLIPAAKSSIQCLETLRLDSLEIKSIIEQTPSCVICTEGLDYSDGDVAAQEEDPQILITRMPCLHYYHQDCMHSPER